MNRKVILSIKPKYADMILNGEKRFELRRKVPQRSFGEIYIYATKPVGKVIGEIGVQGVIKETIEDLWGATWLSNGVSKQEFLEYFKGVKVGYAIVLHTNSAWRWKCPTSIGYYGLKRPPQNFAYTKSLDFMGRAIND